MGKPAYHRSARASACRRFIAVAGSTVFLTFAIASTPPPAHGNGDVKPLSSIPFAQDDDVACLLSAVETGDPSKGASTVILKAPPGCVVPWHYHSAEEQAIVIRGAVRMEMAGHEPMTLGSGGFAVMRSKVPHQFSCIGKAPCLLTVSFDGVYDIFWVKE